MSVCVKNGKVVGFLDGGVVVSVLLDFLKPPRRNPASLKLRFGIEVLDLDPRIDSTDDVHLLACCNAIDSFGLAVRCNTNVKGTNNDCEVLDLVRRRSKALRLLGESAH